MEGGGCLTERPPSLQAGIRRVARREISTIPPSSYRPPGAPGRQTRLVPAAGGWVAADRNVRQRNEFGGAGHGRMGAEVRSAHPCSEAGTTAGTLCPRSRGLRGYPRTLQRAAVPESGVPLVVPQLSLPSGIPETAGLRVREGSGRGQVIAAFPLTLPSPPRERGSVGSLRGLQWHPTFGRMRPCGVRARAAALGRRPTAGPDWPSARLER